MEKSTKCTYVYLPHHRNLCLDPVFIYTSQILYYFHFVFRSISTLFLYCFLAHLITKSEFKLCGTLLTFSAHETRLGSNMFIHLQSGLHLFSGPLRLYKSSFHYVVQSNVKPCSRFEFSHILSPQKFHLLKPHFPPTLEPPRKGT